MTNCTRSIVLGIAGAATALAFGATSVWAPPRSTAEVFGLGRAPRRRCDSPDGPKLTWNYSVWGKKRAFTAGIEKLSALLAAKTGGNWMLKIHYGAALSKSRENLDGLKIGAFEGAMFCNFYHPKKNPALMALTLPFLPMASWDDNRKVRDAVYAHPAVKKELARWNAMTYASSYLPQYELLGKGKPPVAPADWKGMTVRAGGGLGRAMKKLGATPTTSTAIEVYTGIQQGTMQAVSFPFTYAHVAYKIHEVAEWYTANLAPGTSDCPLTFAISAYKKLPAQYKKLLDDVKEEVITAQIATFRKAAGRPVIEAWIKENQGKFDARGLVKSMFAAVGKKYE